MCISMRSNLAVPPVEMDSGVLEPTLQDKVLQARCVPQAIDGGHRQGLRVKQDWFVSLSREDRNGLDVFGAPAGKMGHIL